MTRRAFFKILAIAPSIPALPQADHRGILQQIEPLPPGDFMTIDKLFTEIYRLSESRRREISDAQRLEMFFYGRTYKEIDQPSLQRTTDQGLPGNGHTDGSAQA
jgi:hypothetical protein